jgi:hypothetical protein
MAEHQIPICGGRDEQRVAVFDARSPIRLMAYHSGEKVVLAHSFPLQFRYRPRAERKADVPMLRRRFVSFLEVQIAVAVAKAVLARERLSAPLQPAESQRLRLHQLTGQVPVKVALGGPAENTRLAVVVPSAGVQIEQHRQKRLRLVVRAAEPELHVRPAREVPQHRSNLGSEPRAQRRQIGIESVGQRHRRAVDGPFGPDVALVGNLAQDRKIRRALRDVAQSQNRAAADVGAKVRQERGNDAVLVPGLDNEIEIVGIVGPIANEREDWIFRSVATDGLEPQRCDPDKAAGFVPGGQDLERPGSAICAPPRADPLRGQESRSRPRLREQLAPRGTKFRQRGIGRQLRNSHAVPDRDASTTRSCQSSIISSVHSVSPR